MTISLGSRHVADNIVMHQNMGKTNFMNDAKNIDQKREYREQVKKLILQIVFSFLVTQVFIVSRRSH